MMCDNEDVEIIEFVQRSKYRQRVLKSLQSDVLMPKYIAKRSGVRKNHVSKILSELKSYELVELINPEVHKGRIYRITPKGAKIINELKL